MMIAELVKVFYSKGSCFNQWFCLSYFLHRLNVLIIFTSSLECIFCSNDQINGFAYAFIYYIFENIVVLWLGVSQGRGNAF